MAQRVSGKVKVSGAYQDVLFPTHVKAVIGLTREDKINRDLLPTADSSLLGGVKLSSAYNPTSADAGTALSQAGAKALYGLIQNLESPFDYVSSNTTSISGTTSAADKTATRNAINNFINSWLASDYPSVTRRAGTAVVLRNSNNAYMDTSSGATVNIKGGWLYLYDGSNWYPSIDFPEIGQADDSGANLESMVEGLITKAMLWKLKGIQAGAQVNTVTSVAGKTGAVTLAKSDVGLGSVDNLSAASIRSGITSANVTGALGFTPYNATNPNNYISAAGAPVQSVAGKTGAVTLAKGDVGLGNVDNLSAASIRSGITSGNVTGALGFTPYNATNPSGYINAAGAPVQSVAGKTGAVTLAKGDVGLGNVANVDTTNASNISSGTLSSSRLSLASVAEAETGTDTSKLITPSTGKALVDMFASLKIYSTLPSVSTIPDGKIVLKLEEVIDKIWIESTEAYWNSQSTSNRGSVTQSWPDPMDDPNTLDYGFALKIVYQEQGAPEPVDLFFQVG